MGNCIAGLKARQTRVYGGRQAQEEAGGMGQRTKRPRPAGRRGPHVPPGGGRGRPLGLSGDGRTEGALPQISLMVRPAVTPPVLSAPSECRMRHSKSRDEITTRRAPQGPTRTSEDRNRGPALWCARGTITFAVEYCCGEGQHSLDLKYFTVSARVLPPKGQS